jgi:glycosyltransferase involved in cell wall biosynthesis
MRIAVFTSQFPGRVNTFFARDVRALLDAGLDVDVFPLYPLDDRYWAAVPECLGAHVLPRSRVHHLTLRRGLLAEGTRTAGLLPAALADLTRACASAVPFGPRPLAKTAYAVAKGYAWARGHRERYDHVLAYWGNYAATAAYVFHRLTCEDVPFSMFLHAGTDLYRDQVFLRAKLAHSDNVILVCEFNRRFLYQLYPDLQTSLETKIHIHHLPLDLDEFAFDARDRASQQLVAVGALEPLKGHETLLRAAAALDASGRHEFRVLFLGDGSCRAALERMAASAGLSGRVTFAGWTTPDAARRAICAATMLVHPSAGLGDAVPTVIKEALAVGTPVIASDVAGVPELLDHGNCGMLVPPRDADALTRAIAQLLDNPALRQRYAHAGRAHAERTFDIRRNGARLALILAGSGRTPRVGSRVAVRETVES